MSASGVVSNGDGTYTLTATGFGYAPEASNAEVYGYIAQDLIDVETYAKPDQHYALYDNLASDALAFGDVGTYESAANVEGCQKCHGAPYRKHGYREAVVNNLPNFAACKVCHYDTRNGGHTAWQYMVDDPFNWASGVDQTPEQAAQYVYTANIMNDVHMSHAMEFPYPQSMANCATCHEGKLTTAGTGVLDDNKFVAATCKSCHSVTGDEANYPDVYTNRPPPLSTVWPDWHAITDDCSLCHQGQVAAATKLSVLHTGYNSEIYNASGEKYSDLYQATIESVSVTGTTMDVVFSTNNPSITNPVVMIAFYGYDTKNFIISARSKTIGGSGTGYTEVPRQDGKFEVTYDLNAASTSLGTVPVMVAAGQIKMAEVAVRPVLKDATGLTVAMNAVSETYSFADNDVVPNYYKGSTAIVSEAKCNACHDSLATTFHTGDRGGNIVVCAMCHVPTSGGSHLEMQSRSIDSYVHAIHSFQAFDSGDVDFTDPVEAARYALHIEHTFPNFTIQSCKGCHVNDSVINVPDQRESMGGLLSRADTWNVQRDIGAVPAYLTGPASRACGACHRAEMINEDAAGDLASFNGHVQTNGYLIEDTSILYQAIDKIQSLFN